MYGTGTFTLHACTHKEALRSQSTGRTLWCVETQDAFCQCGKSVGSLACHA